jgi:hypothetical protein
MTIDEMRAIANDCSQLIFSENDTMAASNKLAMIIWFATAEICDRLDRIIEQNGDTYLASQGVHKVPNDYR